MDYSKVEVVNDRLSELPDEILIHILSFLPTYDSVRTMLLRPFGTLWTLLPSFDINDFHVYRYRYWDNASDGSGDDNVNAGDGSGDDNDECSPATRAFFIFVRNVLVRHSRPKITRFRLNINWSYLLYEHNGKVGDLSYELDSWVNFALRKDVEILDINVGITILDEELFYRLPHTEFVSDSITELKLEFLEMTLQTRFQMGLLRVLRLIYVMISDSVFREIILGCPLLKEVEINNCILLNELIIDAPNVEKLILDTPYYCPIVDCPNLKSFWFTGSVDYIEFQDLSSLVDVRFNLKSRNEEFKEFEQFITALKPALSAKFVSFSCESVTVLFYCMEKHLPQMSMNWKRVELCMWLTEKHIPGLCRMLRNSPHLEELVIDFTSWHYDFLQPIESELDSCSIDEEDCCSRSLKRVVIYNSSRCSYPCLVHLISSLLNNATVLAELVIYYKAADKSLHESVLSSEQWTEFSNNLLTFPRASQDVIVSLFKAI